MADDNAHHHADHHADDEGYRRRDPIVGEGRLIGPRRRAVEQRCNRLSDRIAELDAQLLRLSRQRRDTALELKHHRRRLWPALHRCGRQPAPDGGVQLPPVPSSAQYLWGRRLRSTCLALLTRLGPCALPDLHAVLHRLGFAVAGRYPAKALADALGHETDAGRVVRVRRGVYETPAGTPAPNRLWRGGPALPPEVPPAALDDAA